MWDLTYNSKKNLSCTYIYHDKDYKAGKQMATLLELQGIKVSFTQFVDAASPRKWEKRDRKTDSE